VDDKHERELCRKYAARIRGYGLRHLRDAATAEDLVQHVLLILLSAVREGRAGDPARLDGWVLVTCRNCVMDMRRGEQRQRRLAVESAAALPASYLPESYGVDRMRLEVCLMGLESRALSIVLASYVEDRDAEEIGRALALSAGNVRVIRHRALAQLEACVEGRAS
jgi:RNA polymerase sigma-70 factor, ECF subfamily